MDWRSAHASPLLDCDRRAQRASYGDGRAGTSSTCSMAGPPELSAAAGEDQEPVDCMAGSATPITGRGSADRSTLRQTAEVAALSSLPGGPKRPKPLPAYMRFMQDFRQDHSELGYWDCSQQGGAAWTLLTEAERASWKELGIQEFEQRGQEQEAHEQARQQRDAYAVGDTRLRRKQERLDRLEQEQVKAHQADLERGQAVELVGQGGL
jgi:hypothetical protein